MLKEGLAFINTNYVTKWDVVLFGDKSNDDFIAYDGETVLHFSVNQNNVLNIKTSGSFMTLPNSKDVFDFLSDFLFDSVDK